MAGFVLDVSSSIPLVLGDEYGPDSTAIETAFGAGATAYVPTLWRYEVTNALWNAVRRDRIDDQGVASAIDLIGALPIDQVETSSAVVLADAARLHDLTTYDTAYLLLAQRLALPLATRNERLRAAARAGEVDLLDEIVV